MRHPRLYKRDSKGKLRFWQVESDSNKYRTIAGIVDVTSSEVTSGWTTCTAKSQATDEQQCEFEVSALYTNKLTRSYHSTPETTDTPNFFEPMLAKTCELAKIAKIFSENVTEVYSQPKLDGIRCIARAEGLFSRQGKPINAVPHIHASLAPLFAANPDLILDGELYNHELRDDFGEICSIVKKQNPSVEQLEKAEAVMQYHVYDMPSAHTNFGARSDALRQLLREVKDVSWIVPVETVRVLDLTALDVVYGAYLEDGYEGQMVRLDGPYELKRSGNLLKRKEFQDAEYEIVSIEEGNGNWAGLAKRVTLRLPDGRTFGAGIRGNADRARQLLQETHRVATVRFFALSKDAVPRFPVVTKFWGAERTL